MKFFVSMALSVCCLGIRAQVLPLDPAVKTGKLANGLTFYIRHNAEPKDRVQLYLVGKMGSILEDADQQGLAHFMEHMNFNGTKHYPKNQLEDHLEKAGVRFGADLNAYTSYDETVYMLPVPVSMWRQGLGIIRDWAQDALLDSMDIQQEKGVVLEEARLRLGASERLQRLTLPMTLNRSRYVTRQPIGDVALLKSFKPASLRRFHHDWYRPDLEAVIVVGDVDVADVEKELRRLFGDLQNPSNERVRTIYSAPLTGRSQYLRGSDRELGTVSLQLLYKHRAMGMRTAAEYRASVVRGLWGMALNDRFAALVRGNPPFLSGGAQIDDLAGGLDAFTAVVNVAGVAGLEAGFKAVWREVRRVAVSGFTAEELDRARQNYWSQVESIYKERDKMTSDGFVKEYVELYLHGTVAPGIVYERDMVQQLLKGITLRSLDSVTKEYLGGKDRDIVLLGPEKDSAALPGESVVLGWMDAVAKETEKDRNAGGDVVVKGGNRNAAGTDRNAGLPLLGQEPVAGKIIRTERDSALGLTTLTLSNGIRVILKKTDYQNNQILFNGWSGGGSSLYGDPDVQPASDAAGLVSLSGVGNYDALALGKLYTGKQVQVAPFITDRSQGVSGGASPDDLEDALRLVYGYFTEPRADTALFRDRVEKTRASLAASVNDPGHIFSDTIQAVLGNYNIRRMGLTKEKLDQANALRSFAIYKELFGDAAGFQFIMVGNIDEAAIRPLLEKYLASLPSSGGTGRAPVDRHARLVTGRVSRTIHKGKEDKATVFLVWSGDFEYNYINTLRWMVVKEALTLRLLDRLRETEAGVYTPGVQLTLSKWPAQRWGITVSFGCKPANVERMISATMEEVDKMKTQGPLAEDMEKFRAGSHASFETGVKSNGFWLSYLAGQIANEEPLRQVLDYEKLLDGLDAAGVKNMMQQFMGEENFARMVLLPE